MPEPDPAAFTAWMATHAGRPGARLGRTLTGGNSNVTLLVESDAGPLVLRRPPADTISPDAARGVAREHRVLQALHAAGAPVPAPVAFCDDPAVVGAPFQVVEFVPGVSITEELPTAYPPPPGAVDRLGEELIDALAAVHRVDGRAAGLGDFGRPEGFVVRQIERWRTLRAETRVRDLPRLEEVGAWLAAHVPPEAPPAVVHGDYHLDNVLCSPTEPRLLAVIDWELATVADPLVDLGLVLAFWGERPVARPGFAFVQAVSRRPDVVPRDELAARWAAATGRSVAHLRWFLAFALWRLAAIVEGAWVLQAQGRVDSEYGRRLEHDVPALLEEAAAHAGG